jgi:CubicO group peptidase (beta-lactamase class C family)
MPELDIEVSGFARGRFEPLVEVFARLTGSLGTGGAALAIVDGGELVVDLVAGDYRPGSVQLLFSVSKSVSAVAAAIAHRDGLLDLDAPLGSYWPAFTRPATAMISVRDVLAHRSGLAAFERRLSFSELLAGADEAAIEVQDPYWEPGTAHGYHAFTYGTLLGGVFRRALGQTVGEFLAERVSAPLGLDLWLGAPDEVLPRVSRIRYGPTVTTPGGRAHAAVNKIPPSPSGQLQASMDFYNDPAVARACLPSTSGIGSARALARLFAATLGPVDGVRLLSDADREAMSATQSRGPDRVLGFPTHFGSGVQRPFPLFTMLSPASFGHEAAGGSAVAADPVLGLAVGFTTNVFPASRGGSPAWMALQSTIRHLVENPEP